MCNSCFHIGCNITEFRKNFTAFFISVVNDHGKKTCVLAAFILAVIEFRKNCTALFNLKW